MSGLRTELEKAFSPPQVMESIGDTTNTVVADGANNNMCDDGSLMNFPAKWPMSASGLYTAIPSQFTIFFNGNTFVYDGIPAEKVQEIMLIAAAYAKSAEMKFVTQSSFTRIVPAAAPSSPQGTTNNLASPPSVSFPPPEKSSICRLQNEFPLSRRHSLQRFLEKRRDRLGSKAPYDSSSKKVDGNMVSLNQSNEGFQTRIAAS